MTTCLEKLLLKIIIQSVTILYLQIIKSYFMGSIKSGNFEHGIMSAVQKQAALESYYSGTIVRDIASQYNVSTQYIYQVIRRDKERKAGVPTKSQRANIAAQVLTAIQKGLLIRQTCEICSAKKVHAHHDDYNYPLKVRWLCEIHHKAWHSKNTPIYVVNTVIIRDFTK